MAASLSAYWVKFFKGAGFPLDVATKHAVVFSNNRIKPDMLPDLDKPSLKEMGITLMGDMIAILRYAKKVVEETTCERFLVDTVDDKPTTLTNKPLIAKTPMKKVITKLPSKSLVIAKPKIIQDSAPIKPAIKSSPASTITRASTNIVKKKILPSPRVISQVTKQVPKVPVVKRKLIEQVSESETDDDDDEDDEDDEEEEEEGEWTEKTPKRLKLSCDDDKVGYTVIMPKINALRNQEIMKKITEQKRTVFDRLGDSSVTSTTTNLTETAGAPIFNITGLGNDVLKRNSSVFNRLGDKDAVKKMEKTTTGILKNGTTTVNVLPALPPGILKTTMRPSSIGSTTIAAKTSKTMATNKTTGTMHADHEKNKKIASSSVRQLVRTTKKIRLNEQPIVGKLTTKVVRKIDNPASKLASERIASVPAKSRLGLGGSTTTKQVTFDRVTKIARIKKPGVFSRLGV